MAATRLMDWKTAALTVAVVAGAAGLLHHRLSDVELGRRTFEALAAGASSAQSRVDWDHLTALGVDVGAAYRALGSQDRRAYREAFVTNFARGFQSTGATARAFVHWRVEQRTPHQVVVAAEYPAKRRTLLVLLPAAGPKRVVGIGWKDEMNVWRPSYDVQAHPLPAWQPAERQ